jgi:hypothetical protein
MRLLHWVIALLLVGSGVTAASVFSRQAQDRQVAEFSGTIATVDPVALRIRPGAGSVVTFVVDDPSSLPPGLAAGARVTVRYETREGGGRRLLSVGLAQGSNAAAPGPAAVLSALDAGVPLRAVAALEPSLLALDAREPRADEANGSATPAASGRCPLQLVALALLVATGALLVVASWR